MSFKLSGKKIPPEARHLFPSREPLQGPDINNQKAVARNKQHSLQKKSRTSLRPGSWQDRERHQKHVNIQTGKQIVKLQGTSLILQRPDICSKCGNVNNTASSSVSVTFSRHWVWLICFGKRGHQLKETGQEISRFQILT